MHAREAGPERLVQSRALGELLTGGGEEDREQDAARPAHAGRDQRTDASGRRRGIGERQERQRGDQAARAGGQRRAGIAVARLAVEPVELGLEREQPVASGTDRGFKRGILAGRLAILGAPRGERPQRDRRGPGDAAPSGRPDRRRECRGPVGIEAHQRHREAVHIERGHVGTRPEQEANALPERRLQHGMGDHAHLDRRHRAEIVEDERVVLGPWGERRQQTVGHHRDDARDLGERDTLDAGFAMDAKAELGLVFAHAGLEGLAGDRAGRERDAERADIARGGPGGGGDGREIGARLAEMPGDLVHEERARDPARLRQVGQRDIVGDDRHLDLEALGAGPLGREAEIQPVAGIVLDDEQAAGRAGGGADAGEHRLDAGRGEDLARDRGGQHAGPDEAGMARLMAGAPPDTTATFEPSQSARITTLMSG